MGMKTQKQRKCCYHNLNAKQLIANNRPLAKKIYVIIKNFKFNPPKLTHNCKLLTTNYNADHNGDGDSDNDSTIF